MEKLLNYNGLEKYNDLIHEDLAKKANINGYYESLGAGTADQLSSNIVEKDSTPYNFRTAGGSVDIGDREVDKIIGGTVAWNQLVQNGNFASTSNWSTTTATFSVSDNVGKFTATAQWGKIYQNFVAQLLSGHKYLMSADVKGTTDNFIDIGFTNKYVTQNDTWQTLASVFTATSNAWRALSIGDRRTSGWTEVQVKNVQFFDLTQMFGSTIADYIYSLEQANAGAGVAFFRNLFPKPCYEYNAGELMSVNTSAHNTVGFNAWDEVWENGYLGNSGVFIADANSICSKNYIPIKQSATYYAVCPSGKSLRICSYDADKNFISLQSISNQTFTLPISTEYIKWSCYNYGATYNNDICINLSWDGERDGEYEAYVKHSYALDSSLTLRGIPKLDASNNLYYDGDEYESDGNVQRKYAVINLGDYNVSTPTSRGEFRIMTNQLPSNLAPKNADVNVIANALSTKYTMTTAGITYAGTVDKTISVIDAYISIVDSSYTTASDLKTALNGVYIVYELATPTTETADPYTNPQIVDDFGTEEYVDYAYANGDRDVAIPVGHYTEYMANLKAKLEMAPDSPEGAGDYIMRQTNGTNEYVSLASNATIQNIIARLEALEGGGE